MVLIGRLTFAFHTINKYTLGMVALVNFAFACLEPLPVSLIVKARSEMVSKGEQTEEMDLVSAEIISLFDT